MNSPCGIIVSNGVGKISPCFVLMKLASLIAAALLAAAPSFTQAAEPAAAPPAPAPATEKARSPGKPKAKRDWYPFRGEVAAVDRKAMTVALKKQEGERLLQVDSKTTFTRAGKPITLGDIKVGEYAHGKLHKNAKGQEVITDSAFDPSAPKRNPNPKRSEAAKPAK